ncbi:CocE/NonD family hydrolase [Nocardioides sp. SYSU D00038]|uniref:CocE/NonD family hydrolase n=1 Tax=Nocardioides sp. SYSU D00038 TaxID=2812554 RepID=UPI0019675698|nr:CocE/NonD family hydrolase [Nocardioides sp. SYSU D00038]
MTRARLAAVSTVLALAASGLALTAPTASATAPTAATAGPSRAAAPAAPARTWRPRPATYAGVATQSDLAIPTSDGKLLRADLRLPAGADGKPVPGRHPVIITITAYNKSLLGRAGGLGGADSAYLVRRGYAHLTVDARGTGSSEGTWDVLGPREAKDAKEVVEWASSSARPWSNGRVGMNGPSYMGISQVLAAGQHPRGLRAIFPQVPGADVYRDVVASGGQLDVGFMPLWLGLVTGAGLIPPAVTASNPASGLGALLAHLVSAGTVTAALLVDAVLGGKTAYDGPFYAERTPMRFARRITVPTFLVSGEYDLFQRGTPLIFENLRNRKVPVKLVVGPWDHLQASGGAEFGRAGLGSLSEVQLRWFDRYVRGVKDPTLHRDIKPLTYHEIGTGRWRTSHRWIGKQRARSFRLSGRSTTGGAKGLLTEGRTSAGTAKVLPIPVQGLCTRSTNQWTAGLPNAVLPQLPCFKDNAVNDRLGVVFQTEPLRKPLRFQGPINARLYTSSAGGDGMLSVSVSDVAPDGTVDRITGGWQVLSHRALDKRRTRYLDGKVLQPFHPFTRAAQKKLRRGEIAPVDVEIFPTAAKIKRGHRLRVSIQAFDVPHLLPNLALAAGMLSVLTVHTGPKHPSELTVPGSLTRRGRVSAWRRGRPARG